MRDLNYIYLSFSANQKFFQKYLKWKSANLHVLSTVDVLPDILICSPFDSAFHNVAGLVFA